MCDDRFFPIYLIKLLMGKATSLRINKQNRKSNNLLLKVRSFKIIKLAQLLSGLLLILAPSLFLLNLGHLNCILNTNERTVKFFRLENFSTLIGVFQVISKARLRTKVLVSPPFYTTKINFLQQRPFDGQKNKNKLK